MVYQNHEPIESVNFLLGSNSNHEMNMSRADVSNSTPMPEVTPRSFGFERTICDLNNMARLISLAADELLLNRHGVTDPDIVRMPPADQAMLLYGIGELERMSADLRVRLR